MRAETAIAAVVEAAKSCGFDVDGCRILRVGENAAVVLPAAGVFARVAPGDVGVAGVRDELAVAEWLSASGVPAALPRVAGPLVAQGCVVSFWEYLPNARSADLGTLGMSLRALHRLVPPSDIAIRPITPFPRFAERLASGQSLTDADREFLRGYRDDLQHDWDQLVFDLDPCLVHGDAHMDNLLIVDGRGPVFVDLENVGVGQPEWDLTLTALYRECGWFTDADYQSFVGAYGFDVRSSTAWTTLRGIRMLRMVTWLAQSAGDDPERALQLRHRLDTLRDGSAPSGWSGY